MNSGLYETRSGQKYQLQTTRSYLTKKREKKTVSVSAWKVTNFLSTFLWPQSDQHKGSFGIWGFSHFGCFSADVLAENDVTDIMGV